MLETISYLRTRSEIRSIQKLDSGLLSIATAHHGAKIFSHKEDVGVKSFSHEQLNGSTSASSFSPNGDFFAFSDTKNIYILHIQSKTLLKTIRSDGEYIQNLHFDAESKYIIASTKSGRVLQYRYDGSSLIARLYSFKKISDRKQAVATAFAFHNKVMACGGNNGTIFLINLHSRANKITFSHTKAAITSLCFVNSQNIISADANGSLYFHSLKDNSLTKTIETCFTEVREIVLMPNPNYVMVIGNEKHAAVYDIVNYKLLQSKYVEFDDVVTHMVVADKTHMVATLRDNSIEIVKLPNTEELKSLILHNSLDKAYNLVKRNPLLKDTKAYTQLELAYNKLYNEALDNLIHENKERALKAVSMFKYVDEKKEDIQMLFKAFENYTRFKSLYIEKKHALAYAMAQKYPPLMKTFQYAKMEELWRDTFKNAQRQLAHGKHQNAVALLKNYATIAEKRPIIKLILNHNDDFIKFLQAIELKKYQIIENFAKNNTLFTQVPTYHNVQEHMKKELATIEEEIIACELTSAVKRLSALENIESIKDTVSLQKEECKAIKRLQDAYDVNNFLRCFELIDQFNFLNLTKLGILLQNHWSKLMAKCESYALKGNVKHIKETLGDLIKLSTRRDKIGDLFRLSFQVRIKAMIANKANKKAEAIIYSYIDIFGSDRELISVMRIYERRTKHKLAITQQSRQARDNWIHSEAIMGV